MNTSPGRVVALILSRSGEFGVMRAAVAKAVVVVAYRCAAPFLLPTAAENESATVDVDLVHVPR
jgi:hypothetical protein